MSVRFYASLGLGLAVVSAWLLVGLAVGYGSPASDQSPPQSGTQVAPAGLSEWTVRLRRELERSCQEAAGPGQRGCFDTEIGGKILNLVPLGEVNENDKARFWSRWNGILQPEYFPRDAAKVAWSKVLLTQVRWAPRPPDARSWRPPTSDWVCARWEAGGRTLVGIEHTLTVALTGAERISYRHPARDEVHTDAKIIILESQIDKPGLLNLLITLFRIPWQGEMDFVVRWSLASPGPNSLRIRSTRFHQEADPPHWREWHDDFSFELSGDDPQYLSFGFRAGPRP
jgi:hypothetical protein